MKIIQRHNRIQFLFNISRDYRRLSDYGWHLFEFGIFKFVRFPEEGGMISPKDYKGFIIRFMFWLPIDSWR